MTARNYHKAQIEVYFATIFLIDQCPVYPSMWAFLAKFLRLTAAPTKTVERSQSRRERSLAFKWTRDHFGAMPRVGQQPLLTRSLVNAGNFFTLGLFFFGHGRSLSFEVECSTRRKNLAPNNMFLFLILFLPPAVGTVEKIVTKPP